MSIRWDQKLDKYTFLDGSTLPEAEPPNYPTEFWKFHHAGMDVEVAITRQNHRMVLVTIQQRAAGTTGSSLPGATSARMPSGHPCQQLFRRNVIGAADTDYSQVWQQVQ
jgi:hypothetical protein